MATNPRTRGLNVSVRGSYADIEHVFLRDTTGSGPKSQKNFEIIATATKIMNYVD